jgi:hypothetical protein
MTWSRTCCLRDAGLYKPVVAARDIRMIRIAGNQNAPVMAPIRFLDQACDFPSIVDKDSIDYCQMRCWNNEWV